MSASTGHHPAIPGYLHPPDKAWARWDKAWTRIIRQITGRDDMSVVVAPGAGGGAPACVYRDLGRIEIDAAYIGDPAVANPLRAGHKRVVKIGFGLLMHEAAHTVHSGWTTPGTIAPIVADVADMLEESRVEAAHRTRRPRDRQYLRAVTTALIHPGDAPVDDAWHAARVAGLLLARVDARIVTTKEVRAVRDAVTGILGRPRLRRLREIWRAAQHTGDDDATVMIDHARRWLDVLGIDPARQPHIPAPEPGEFPGRLAAAIAAWAATACGLPLTDYLAATADGHTHLATALRHGHATTPATWTRRDPTDDERRAARHLSRRLAAARTTHPEPGHSPSPTPPGRLRTRQAITVSAQLAAGQTPTATPWTRRTPQPPDKPTLKIAVLVDVSGSMYDFAAPMSSAAWILAHAAAGNHATTATIAFGSQTTLLTRPGQRPTQVLEMNAHDHIELFAPAATLADRLLDLRHPGALRIVAVVSDGHLADADACQHLVTTLHHSGVTILWLHPADLPSRTYTETTTLHIADPTSAITAIADVMTTALERA